MTDYKKMTEYEGAALIGHNMDKFFHRITKIAVTIEPNSRVSMSQADYTRLEDLIIALDKQVMELLEKQP